MTFTQNQGTIAPANVLHDQGTPNTLGGLGPANAGVAARLPIGALTATVLILAVLAILAARLA